MALAARRLFGAVLLAGLVGLLGCAGPGAEAAPAVEAAGPVVRASPPEPVASARVGVPAPSTRVRFVPTVVRLPGGAQASVRPARTVDGVLVVPENVRHVGWWDGSAEAGDPFGSTVVAGHVDSATDGIGFFARLLRIRPGEVVTVRGSGHRAAYQVTSVRTVAKRALATSGSALDQDGEHRLVLITCTGGYRADRGGYDSNLVVTAEPIGPSR